MGRFGPDVALAARIVLAVVLLGAAVAKLADRAALPGRLRAMGVPDRWSAPLAAGLPVAEVGVAVALVAAVGSPVPALVGLVLLGAFTVFLAVTASRAVPCPCFGSVRSASASSAPAAIVRNGVLMGVGVLATASITGARAGGTVVAGVILGAAAGLVVLR